SLNPDGAPSAARWYPSPAVATDDTIYVTSPNGSLFAVTRDGAVKWRAETFAERAAALWTSPAIAADGTIYWGELRYGRLVATPPDGTLRFEVAIDTINGSSISDPVVDGAGNVWIGAGSKHAVRVWPRRRRTPLRTRRAWMDRRRHDR